MAGWDVQTEQCPDTDVVFCSFQGIQDRICDPLCEIQAKVSKSNYEIKV